MPRYQGTTTARGYGSSHQALRARLLAAWKPGQPCARCGQPMWHRWKLDQYGRRVTALHLGHTDDRRGYTGLEHDTCNLRDGQAKTTVINRARGTLTPRQIAAIRYKQWQAAARRR
jgi:hypothetical protein